MDEPPVRFIVLGKDQYRFENQWPPSGVVYKKFYLNRFGKLSLTPEVDKDLPPDILVHQSPLVSNKKDELTYSFTFYRETEVTGPIALYLYASLDQDDGVFVATLYDVSPTGERTMLEKALLKASHRFLDKELSTEEVPYIDHTRAEKVLPGQIYEFAFSFAPISYVFKPGHKLVLSLTTQDTLPQVYHHKLMFMSHILNTRATVFKIYRDAEYKSRLIVPIVTNTKDRQWIEPIL